MYHLVYTSHATQEFSEADLIQLLTYARAFNKKNDITGMLLYVQGKFIQVLEGEKTSVDTIYTLIKKDPRHTKISTVIQGHTPERMFNGWTMGFKKLSFEDAKHIGGFQDVDVFFKQQVQEKESNLLLVFLSLFYKQNLVDYAEL